MLSKSWGGCYSGPQQEAADERAPRLGVGGRVLLRVEQGALPAGDAVAAPATGIAPAPHVALQIKTPTESSASFLGGSGVDHRQAGKQVTRKVQVKPCLNTTCNPPRNMC